MYLSFLSSSSLTFERVVEVSAFDDVVLLDDNAVGGAMLLSGEKAARLIIEALDAEKAARAQAEPVGAQAPA